MPGRRTRLATGALQRLRQLADSGEEGAVSGGGQGGLTLNKHVSGPISAYVWGIAFAAAMERGVVVGAEARGDGIEVVETGGERGEGGGRRRRRRRGRGGGRVGVGVGVGVVDEGH